MVFKCRSCGGNVVYDPEQGRMCCPYCGGLDTQEEEAGNGQPVCASCGAPLETGQFSSAVRCAYCGQYTILDEQIAQERRPRFILPFRLGRKQAETCLQTEFQNRIFAPASFLSEATLSGMEGYYVPFWLYDMAADCHFDGTGTRVRVWRSGDAEYTETPWFRVVRDMQVRFDRIPADASVRFPDAVMDLMEKAVVTEVEPGAQDEKKKPAKKASSKKAAKADEAQDNGDKKPAAKKASSKKATEKKQPEKQEEGSEAAE